MILPKVSVIIPNYNHYPYLRQRIVSVLQQTYPDFEVILLDDGSTDDSPKIIQEFADHPLVKEVVLNERNEGNPFKQWQKGLALAKGEWVWLAESDDYADRRFLEVMVSSLQNQPNAGLAYCDSKIVEQDRILEETFATIKNRKYKTTRWSENYRNSGMNEIEHYLLPFGTINNTSAVLFNRDILRRVNPFDIDFRYIGDKYAFIKVLAVSDVVYVNESLNYYRDPFNTKPADRFLFYFYEQFLVFDFVYRNMTLTDPKIFFEGFYLNTRNSLFRDWSKLKVRLYWKLFRLNGFLFAKSILHNFMKAGSSVFTRMNLT